MPSLPIASLSPRTRLPATAGLLLAAAGVLTACGCTGSGRVHMVPFVRTDLSPRERLDTTLPLHTACYAVEPDGKLILALEHHRGSLLGKAFEADWRMALRLEGLPAGSQRLYRLGPNSLQLALTAGGDLRRAQLFSGVVLLENPDWAGRIRGRFHITVRQQQLNFLTGWSAGGLMVNTGEFEAVRDPERARDIEAATQTGIFSPATMPAEPFRLFGPVSRPSAPTSSPP